MRPVSLPDALRPRAQATAAYLARSLPGVGLWEGYHVDEPLIGALQKPADKGYAMEVVYRRQGFPGAELYLSFLSFLDVQEDHKSKPFVVESDVTERQEYDIVFEHDILYEETLRHTFSRTVSEAEASKAAWEIAAKASLGVEFSGVKAALEVSGKYGEELSRQSGVSETTEDEVVRHLKIQGPIDTVYEAVRSLDKERITRRVRCDYDGKLYFLTPGGSSNVWEWTTYKSQFLPCVQGLTPDDIYGTAEFRQTPPTDKELEALLAPSDKLVEFTYDYDNVQKRYFREGKRG